jgi:hypothetical protein
MRFPGLQTKVARRAGQPRVLDINYVVYTLGPPMPPAHLPPNVIRQRIHSES